MREEKEHTCYRKWRSKFLDLIIVGINFPCVGRTRRSSASECGKNFNGFCEGIGGEKASFHYKIFLLTLSLSRTKYNTMYYVVVYYIYIYAEKSNALLDIWLLSRG